MGGTLLALRNSAASKEWCSMKGFKMDSSNTFFLLYWPCCRLKQILGSRLVIHLRCFVTCLKVIHSDLLCLCNARQWAYIETNVRNENTYVYWNAWMDSRCLLPVMWPTSVYAPNSSDNNRWLWFSWLYYAPFAWLKMLNYLRSFQIWIGWKALRCASAWTNCTGIYCDIVRLKKSALGFPLCAQYIDCQVKTWAKEPCTCRAKHSFSCSWTKFYWTIPALMWDIKSSGS